MDTTIEHTPPKWPNSQVVTATTLYTTQVLDSRKIKEK